MSKDYGLEDICVSLDSIEKQLKRLVDLEKRWQKRHAIPSDIVEVDQI